MDADLAEKWQAAWQKRMEGELRDRSCDKEMGEEIGWLVSPITGGDYWGFRATGDAVWIDRLIDWSDAVIKAAEKEPDGYLGWPKPGGTSTGSFGKDLDTDNILGEAMFLRPMVRLAHDVLGGKDDRLKKKYGDKLRGYLELSEQVFKKWDSRGARRSTKQGGVWVVPPFGIDARRASGRTATGAGRSTDSRCRITSRTSWPCGCWPCTTPPARRSIATGRRRGFR